MNRRLLGLLATLVAAGLCINACSLVGARNKPAVVITSPPLGAQVNPGETLSVQSTATDPSGIVRIELTVDGVMMRTDGPPNPQTSYSVTQTWLATAGTHTVGVRAYNVSLVPSDPATVLVAVAGTPAPVAAPSLTSEPMVSATRNTGGATAVPNGTCVDDAAFVQDVTVADGSNLAPREAFVKAWRIRNTGTCTWGNGYQLTLVAGQVMGEATTVPVPATAPGSTADLSTALVAPSAPATYTSLWRLRNPNGAFFGITLNVTIRVTASASAGPTLGPAVPCSGAPTIESFSASPNVVTAGQSSTLSWGFVSNAETAEIDNNVGGVATPGNLTVRPGATTTYTLSARCGDNIRTAQVTIIVNPAPAPTSVPSPAATATPVPPTLVPTRTPVAGSPTAPPPGAVTRCFSPADSGQVFRAGDSLSTALVPEVGDDRDNNSHRALLSFDIHDLTGKTIQSANLVISANATQGNPFSLGPMSVQQVTFAPPVAAPDYAVAGTSILTINSGPVGSYDVASALQNALGSRTALFQLRFQFATETNGNRAGDLITWNHANDVCLNIVYR